MKASELRKEGKSLEEVVNWVEENKLKFNFFATVDTLNYLKAAGRIKGAKAFFGNIMGVKPIFISDARGNNAVIKKAKGTKNSLEELVNGIRESFVKGETSELFIGQGMAMDRAEIIKKKLKEEFNIEPQIFWIGPIVGTTCGPGIIATYCFGKEVTYFETSEQ